MKCSLSLFLFFFILNKGAAQQINYFYMRDSLYKHVDFLASLTPARNYYQIASLNKAAGYIKDEFEKLGCTVEEQKYKVAGGEYKNIIASFGPKEGSRIVVGAHYDVCGNQPGADDNASAVAGLIELAKMITANKDNLKYRIDFVAYTLEEPPVFATKQMGSAVHAKSLKDSKVDVKAMICLEMIGYFSEKPGSQGFPDPQMKKLYPDKGNFIIVVGRTGQENFTANVKQLMKDGSKIDVQSITLPPSNSLAGLSDHRNYWDLGYLAVMINDTSFLRNPNYHQVTDTIDTLDFDKMAEVVKGVYNVIVNL